METYFEGFHEDEQISGNAYLPTVDEVIKDQLGVLESIKEDEKIASVESNNFKNQYLIGNEDFHQIMSDWQQHVGLLQSIDSEDLGLGLGLGLDCNGDGLNMCSGGGLFEERETSILSKALKSPLQKSSVRDDSTSMLFGSKKDLALENVNSISSQDGRKLSEFIKGESGLLGKVTVLNGEKEILGKNIIGLHCLNEIKENPQENCQVTSTVINGKRYKIIIKPKSLKMKKLSNDKIKKTLIKKLLQCNLVATKTEPKEDEIISEMRNGNYDVPILGNDVLPSWDLVNLDPEWNPQMDNDSESPNFVEEHRSEAGPGPGPEPMKKIPPLRIKIPKLGKKNRRKISVNKSDEDVDVETVNEKMASEKLLKSPDTEVRETNESQKTVSGVEVTQNRKNLDGAKSVSPRQVSDKIEAVKRKRDCRIPLIQAMPSKKAVKCCTRMQDAVATMNRNKLLKIVSGGDTISLDHDYCSTLNKSTMWCQQGKKSRQLNEKNPKKDSGMESGDVSDTSEGANTPETFQNLQSNNTNSRLLQDQQPFNVENEKKKPDEEHQTAESKSDANFFRDTKTAEVKANSNTVSDSVKTETVSNGNKALTNNVSDMGSNSDNSESVKNNNNRVTVPSENNDKCENLKDDLSNDDKPKEEKNEGSSEQNQPTQVQAERPKRKLKLEEYLSRRNIKEREKEKESKSATANDKTVPERNDVKPLEIESKSESANPNNTEDKMSNKGKNKYATEKRDKQYWRDKFRRSSSASSDDKRTSRRGRRSRSRSRRRRSDSSSSSNGKRHEGREKRRRSRWSAGQERRMNFWSGSSSRSPSRESSSSSDYSSSKHSRNSSRYDRRSKSRSSSRGRSRSRNRDYSNRSRFGNYYYRRNSRRRRSRSPYYAYSMREKQRQIEERRVIYVGRIEEGMTSAKLRKRFSIFGPIIDISLHFREYGDNYGFVTYAYKSDAYDAVEHGNDDPSQPRYDLCFGGRRGFCKEKYADLDGMPTSYSDFNDAPLLRNAKDSFDLLLKEAQAKLKNRKKQ